MRRIATVVLGFGPICLAQQAPQLRLPWEQWRVHPGNDPRCAQLQSEACAWQAPGDQSQIDGWRRIEVKLPSELRSAPAHDRQLGLLMQGLDPIYEVFIDGRDIGGSGSFRTRTGPQNSRTAFRLPTTLAADGRFVIAVHSLGIQTSRNVGSLVPTIISLDQLPVVRDADTVSYLRRSWQHYLCYAALGGAGFVFFLLFAVNTRLREYAWMSAILCQLPLLRLGEMALVVNLAMPNWLGLVIYSVCNGVAAFIGIEFIFSFLERPVPRIFRAVQLLGGVGLLQLLLLLPLPYALFDPLARVVEGEFVHTLLITAIFIEAFAWLLLVPGCFKSRLPEMRAIGAAVLFITFMEANRQAHNFGLPNVPQDFLWDGLDVDLRPVAYLIFTIVMLIAMTFRLRRIQGRNREVEQELSAARSVQQILIPHRIPTIPGLAIESAYLPAQQVGGDFFQVLPVHPAGIQRMSPESYSDHPSDAPSAFIVVGDVSGKGLKAAMTVSLIVGTLRASARHCSSPAELLTDLNRCLVDRAEGFTTCLAMTIAPSGKVTLANAGHPRPYLDGVEVETEGNIPLGLTLDVQYGETALQLEPGQRFALITDGVLEASHASSRELFGFDRTQEISSLPAARIAEAARIFGLGAPQADDITVLTLRRVEPQRAQLQAATA